MRTLASDDDGVAGKYGGGDDVEEDDEGQGGAGEYDDDADVTEEVEVKVVDDVAVEGDNG